MKTVFIVLACIAILLGIAFVILPMGSIAVIPSLVGALFAYLAYRKSNGNQKAFPKALLTLAIVLVIGSIAKNFLIKDAVAKDDSFEERVEASEKNAIDELDSIEEEIEEDSQD